MQDTVLPRGPCTQWLTLGGGWGEGDGGVVLCLGAAEG